MPEHRGKSVPANALGTRLRGERQERGMTRAAMGRPEFPAAFVAAVETGHLMPSLAVLTVLAGHLGLDPAALEPLRGPQPAQPDLAALELDAAYQLDLAKAHHFNQDNEAACTLLTTLAVELAAWLPRLSVGTRYRLARLQGFAYMRQGEPEPARAPLEDALRLAHDLGDPQELARANNALGVLYYELELPARAEEFHSRALAGVADGTVRDLNLKLTIFTNLAADYWALNAAQAAIALYREALHWLDDVINPERRAALYWGLAVSYRLARELELAKLYADKALRYYREHGPADFAAQMAMNLAEILTERGEFVAADALLQEVAATAASSGNPTIRSGWHEYAAGAALRAGHLEQAAALAGRSVEVSQKALTGPDRGPRAVPANAIRSAARALAVAGEVAARQGLRAQAERQFTRALDLVHRTEYWETAQQIRIRYARALAGWGDYVRATAEYGRLPRPARLLF